MAIFLEVVTRFGFLSVPCHRHCQPCRASPLFFKPFSVPPVVTAFTSESIELRNGPFFFSGLPRSRLGGLAFAMLACFPLGWHGGFHLWRCLRESLGRLLRPVDSPRFKCLGCRFTLSLWLCSIELLPPSRSGCVQLPLPLLFIIPYASLVFLEHFGFVGVDGVFGSGF